MSISDRCTIYYSQKYHNEAWKEAIADYRRATEKGEQAPKCLQDLLKRIFPKESMEANRNRAQRYLEVKTEAELEVFFTKISSGNMVKPEDKIKKMRDKAQRVLERGSMIAAEHGQAMLPPEEYRWTQKEIRDAVEEVQIKLSFLKQALSTIVKKNNRAPYSLNPYDDRHEQLHEATKKLEKAIRDILAADEHLHDVEKKYEHLSVFLASRSLSDLIGESESMIAMTVSQLGDAQRAQLMKKINYLKSILYSAKRTYNQTLGVTPLRCSMLEPLQTCQRSLEAAQKDLKNEFEAIDVFP